MDSRVYDLALQLFIKEFQSYDKYRRMDSEFPWVVDEMAESCLWAAKFFVAAADKFPDDEE